MRITGTTFFSARLRGMISGVASLLIGALSFAGGGLFAAPEFLRGDADDDGTIQVGDALWLLQHLYVDGRHLACRDAADATDDGRLEIDDAIQIVLAAFLGEPLPAPSPDRGEDPTTEDDVLGCSRWRENWRVNGEAFGVEIEAKWSVDRAGWIAVLETLLGPHPPPEFEAHRLEPLWDGLRLVTDEYYDLGGQLAAGRDSLRYRVRRSREILPPPDFPDGVAGGCAELAAGWDVLDYERVQYKADASRIGAVWFRDQYGESDLAPNQAANILFGAALSEGTRALLREHPGYLLQVHVPSGAPVVQYRYKISLVPPGEELGLYEVSLDRLGACDPEYAVELEIVGERSIESVEGLFELARALERDFPLVRAERSKGNVTPLEVDGEGNH